jgi:acyl dehydratase
MVEYRKNTLMSLKTTSHAEIPAEAGQAKFYEDYAAGHIRETAGRTITETDIVLHAGQTGDFYPHHMDEEWCKTQPFGRRIAHGTLIFSIGIGMTAGHVNPVAMTYGYEHLRFPKPVFIGDTIHARVSITDKHEHKRPGYGIVTETIEVRNQAAEVVLSCEHLLLVKMRSQ